MKKQKIKLNNIFEIFFPLPIIINVFTVAGFVILRKVVVLT